MLGAYGLDWDESGAGFLTVEAAAAIAANTGARIERDPAHGGPFFHTQTPLASSTAWYEDSASILLKLATLDSMGVRKVALWRLGAVPRDILADFAVSSIAARGVAVCMSKDIL